MKARFLEPQPPVKTINSDGKTYVYICLNEQYGEEVYEDPEGTGQPLAYYEYDYNEFSDLTEKLDLEDINAHPEKYLGYKIQIMDSLERRIKEEIEKSIANNLLSTNSNQALSAPMGAQLNLRLEALEQKQESMKEEKV